MATVDNLADDKDGRLVRITVPLGPSEGESIRRVFGVPEFAEWVANTLPTLPTERGMAMSPAYELDDLLFTFTSSKGRLQYNKTFKDLMPGSDEVWELRTPQLRIFGWFSRKDDFVAVFGERKVNLKKPGDYEKAKARVKAVRDALPLDEPKFVGGKINNVVSGI